MPDMPGPWGEPKRDAWEAQREALGAFIRERRKQANLSLRQLAELTSLSNPYLSQIERGLHQPSVRVLRAISDALNLSAESLLAQAGLIDAIAGGNGAGHPRRQAPVRGPEGRPDRRLPQHAQPAGERYLTAGSPRRARNAGKGRSTKSFGMTLSFPILTDC
jgi:transcriptional regulator with XRE-family HTH domain